MATQESNLCAQRSFAIQNYWREEKAKKKIKILKREELGDKSVPETVLNILEGNQPKESVLIENNVRQGTPVTYSPNEQQGIYQEEDQVNCVPDPEEVIFSDENQQIIYRLLEADFTLCSDEDRGPSSLDVSNSSSTHQENNHHLLGSNQPKAESETKATKSCKKIPRIVPNVIALHRQKRLKLQKKREREQQRQQHRQYLELLLKQKQQLQLHAHHLYVLVLHVKEQQYQERSKQQRRHQEKQLKLQQKHQRQLENLQQRLHRRLQEQPSVPLKYIRNQERLQKHLQKHQQDQELLRQQHYREAELKLLKQHQYQQQGINQQIQQHQQQTQRLSQEVQQVRTSLGEVPEVIAYNSKEQHQEPTAFDEKIAGVFRRVFKELSKSTKVVTPLELKGKELYDFVLGELLETRQQLKDARIALIYKKLKAEEQQKRAITTTPTPTPIATPASTPITTPTPRTTPTTTPISSPITTPISSPITSPARTPTPTPTIHKPPTKIQKPPSTEPKATPKSEPTTEPKPIHLPTIPAASLTVEEASRLDGDRIKLLTDLKVREDQEIDKREDRLKKLQREELQIRNHKNDIDWQLRILRNCNSDKRTVAKDGTCVQREQTNPNYKPPTNNEDQRQKQIVRAQQELLKYQRFPAEPRQPLCPKKMMHNEMVSLPVGNLNGGLKATSSGSGVVGTSSVVSSAVLANAPRVYLTPTATFMANRQAAAAAAAAAQATGKIGGTTIVGVGAATSSSATTVASTGTVRYFSQFSKLQTAGGNVAGAPSLQKKLVNGDTIVLSNGTKSRILTSNSSSSSGGGIVIPGPALAPTTAPSPAVASTNGGGSSSSNSVSNCLLTNKMEPIDLDETVIKNNNAVVGKAPVASSSSQQDQPLELVVGNSSDGEEPEPELDITINNVVCSFSVRCHLKLREIALNGSNVEYRRENGMVTMKLRHPYTTASIWSSGRITCTGATSEPMAKVAARRYARCLGKLGFPTRFQNFRIVNVLGTCSMPWAIKIVNFSERHRSNASYEPELHPGVTYKMIEPKATLKIFSTGSITVTAASVNDVESAIQHIYPLVFEFRKQRSAEELLHLRQKQRRLTGGTDPNDLEEIIISENKSAAVNDIFVNTTAAHTAKTAGGTSSTDAIASGGVGTLNSVQRSKQLESYRHMMQQTQEERRHIPFHGSTTTATALNASKPSTAAAAATASSSSSSTSDNICASARRRATECWATKLQNKRPRYNAACATASASNSFSNVASTSAQAQAQAHAQAQAQAQAHLRNPLKTAALANARMRGASQTPMNVALAQSSNTSSSSITASRLGVSGSSAGFLPAQRQQQQQQPRLLQQQQQPKLLVQQRSFSPSDFQVDDLIEEEELNEIDSQY
ncbi:hypothetical protein KR032_000172 [Drosophila birchii]|nr:hypothetical protein KR032_000172 [Drosophila birchii]